jgi:hypothetical protein
MANHINKKEKSIPVGRLFELFKYDPASGLLMWVSPTSHRVSVGDVAGSNDKGHLIVGIDGVKIYAHRVAWAMYFGEWPANFIDHIDGDGMNNAILNLREATRAQNMANMKRPATNSSGFKGVHFHRQSNKWRARIRDNGVHRSLGLFDAPEQAHAAYMDAALRMKGEFARAL